VSGSVESPHTSRCRPNTQTSPCTDVGIAGVFRHRVGIGEPGIGVGRECGQFLVAKADQRQVEPEIGEVADFKPQQVLIPAAVQRQFVVGQYVSPPLGFAETSQFDHRNRGEAKLARRQKPTVARDEAVVTIDQDLIGPAELADRPGNLRHLRVRMGAGVAGIGDQGLDRSMLDREVKAGNRIHRVLGTDSGVCRPLTGLRSPLRFVIAPTCRGLIGFGHLRYPVGNFALVKVERGRRPTDPKLPTLRCPPGSRVDQSATALRSILVKVSLLLIPLSQICSTIASRHSRAQLRTIAQRERLFFCERAGPGPYRRFPIRMLIRCDRCRDLLRHLASEIDMPKKLPSHRQPWSKKDVAEIKRSARGSAVAYRQVITISGQKKRTAAAGAR
jgi:hypothetical protein